MKRGGSKKPREVVPLTTTRKTHGLKDCFTVYMDISLGLKGNLLLLVVEESATA